MFLAGINVNEHDIRFVEDNWESPVKPILICEFKWYFLVYFMSFGIMWTIVYCSSTISILEMTLNFFFFVPSFFFQFG